MRLPRIFVRKNRISGRGATLSGPPVWHLSKVLRCRSGDRIILFTEESTEYLATIEKVQKAQILTRLEQWRTAHSEPSVDVTLLQAIPKQKQIDFILQKATELGVTRFELCYSERAIPRMRPEVEQDRLRRWEQIIIDACSQSGRCVPPALKSICKLEDSVSYVSSEQCFRMLLDPRGETLDKVMTAAEGYREFCLAIGPEGGFSEEETSFLKDQGFTGVHMGPRIMRVETAVVAALTLVQGAAGNLNAPYTEDAWNEFPVHRDHRTD